MESNSREFLKGMAMAAGAVGVTTGCASAAGGAGPVRIFFRRLFPPYRQMRQFGYCGWLNGRPYLLPVAWIVRIFRCVFTRSPAESLKTASEPFRYKNEIGDRADFLARLGIPLDREFF